MLDVCDSFKLNSNIFKSKLYYIKQVKEYTFFCIPTTDIREKKTILRQTKAEVNDLPEILSFAVENAINSASNATQRTDHVISFRGSKKVQC